MGFSLGGNFALRVARRLADVHTLAVCPAIEPERTMHRIDRNPVYQRYFVRKWRRQWRGKQAAFPEQYDFAPAMALSTVSALTDYFVHRHSGFPTTDSYFEAYDLSGNALAGVDAHVLMAADDPIIALSQFDNLPASIAVEITDHGGHGAYLSDWRLNSWVDGYAVEHFRRKLLGSESGA